MPLAAIQAATATGAHVLGLVRETGQVAPGLAADLLAVAGNRPRASPRWTRCGS